MFEEYKKNCFVFWEIFANPWPKNLDCSSLPDVNDSSVCIGYKEGHEPPEIKGKNHFTSIVWQILIYQTCRINSYIYHPHPFAILLIFSNKFIMRIHQFLWQSKFDLSSVECQTSQISCDAGRCLDYSFLCDGYRDCEDNSDEAHCGECDKLF